MNLKKFLNSLAVAALAAALLLLFALLGPGAGRAQSTAQRAFVNRWNELTNAAGQVSTNIAADLTGLVLTNPGVVSASTSGQIIFPINRGRGLAFLVIGRGTGAGTNTTQTYGLDLTVDGTNWTTTQPIQFTVAATGTNQQTTFTNILADRLDNAAFGCLTTISGGTTGYNWTNQHIYWSGIP